MFIIYKVIFIASRSRLLFAITFIPLFELYSTSRINNVQLTMNGVLYNNCDNIKLLMLYSRVIPSTINNNDIMVLIIEPSLFP